MTAERKELIAEIAATVVLALAATRVESMRASDEANRQVQVNL